MEKSLVKRVLGNLEKRRERVLTGGINCIPTPFPSFSSDFPGIEQGKYYLVSGSSKGGKTQIANYLFVYTPILYAYLHPEQLRVQIFYFPLEETPEKIIMRFMCHLLYLLSGAKIRLSPLELGSIDKNHVVDKAVLDALNGERYADILEFFEEHVHFMSDRNATGCYKTVSKYAEAAGTVHRKTILVENKETGVSQSREVFDYYEPKDPDEYVIILWDHASLTDGERGMTMKERIDKLSEYFMIMRNHYNYTPVLIQQQGAETIDSGAVKTKRVAPTLAGLSDSKNPGKDCSMMIGITNPFSFGFPEYKGWDITRLRDYARFIEIVLNREGQSNGLLATYFDGAVNYFTSLPKSTDSAGLNKFYSLVRKYSGDPSQAGSLFETNNRRS